MSFLSVVLVQVNGLLHGTDLAVVARGEPCACLLQGFATHVFDNLLDLREPSVCWRARLDPIQAGKSVLEHLNALDIPSAYVSKSHQFGVCRGNRNDTEP